MAKKITQKEAKTATAPQSTPNVATKTSELQIPTANPDATTSEEIVEVVAEEVMAADDELLTQEIKDNTHIFEEFFDLDYAKSLAKLLEPIDKYYFRATLIGFDEELGEFPARNNPKRPLIFVSNHSGMAFPWDGMVFASALMKMNGYKLDKAARGLASPMLSQTNLMNPFLIHNFWKRAGGIDATSLNFETMMHYGESNFLIYPEGIKGIGKGFDKRYQLQRVSSSAVRMSIKYKTDIIPFATINAEYINPFSYSLKWLDDIVQSIGIPFIPVGPLTTLILLQPWMFYFAAPAKLTYVRGKRIKPYEMIDKPFEEITLEEFRAISKKIQKNMQAELSRMVEMYGQNPYDWGGFFRTILQNFSKLPYFVPIAWPFLFTEHERRYRRFKTRLAQLAEDAREAYKEAYLNEKPREESLVGLVKTATDTILKNPEVLLLYVPLVGWIPTLIKGFSREED
ncbi:1-acyl-sn-glycerol-3-phosphate acyltransferase [uncultured Microscilla sp.]|uniref:1-acyl-sn-glycerol-3-phosphate acyltransferase n=1 Tax=uncultured Microscilla sp. TaxID=432653 RepID=UPI0026385D2C|nr:1-acyl-sn-glycerol-3-phosphate acyltransferase [uncultured Microscilla sp.]